MMSGTATTTAANDQRQDVSRRITPPGKGRHFDNMPALLARRQDYHVLQAHSAYPASAFTGISVAATAQSPEQVPEPGGADACLFEDDLHQIGVYLPRVLRDDCSSLGDGVPQTEMTAFAATHLEARPFECGGKLARVHLRQPTRHWQAPLAARL